MLKEEFDAIIEELKSNCVYRQFDCDSERVYVFETFELYDGLQFQFKYSKEHGCNIIETGKGIKCTDMKIVEIMADAVRVELITNGFKTATFSIRRKNPLFRKFKEISSILNMCVPYVQDSDNAATYIMDYRNENSCKLQILAAFGDESRIRFRISNPVSNENILITGEDIEFLSNKTECILVLKMANGFEISMAKLRKEKLYEN